MFDGHALLLVVVGLLLLAGSHAIVSSRRESDDEQWARRIAPPPETPQPQLIRVVCGACGAELCDVLTPRDADLESEAHRLAAHGGGR